MRWSVGRTLIRVLVLVATGAPAAAQNLLVNPDFSNGLAGWEVLGSSWYSVLHDPGVGFVAPGSLQILTADAPLAYAVARQCLAVSAGQVYDVGGWFRGTPGQPDVLRGFMGVTWFSDGGCTTLDANVVTNVSSAAAGIWQKLAGQSLVAPAAAQSARVSLVFVPSSGSAQGHFDDVYFGPHPTTPVELQEFSIE